VRRLQIIDLGPKARGAEDTEINRVITELAAQPHRPWRPEGRHQDGDDDTRPTAQRPRARRMTIADIKVGRRYRRDPGDIDELAASLADVGLLHPVVVRTDGHLIAGARRLAAKKLGWDKVPVTVVDIDKVVSGEYAENVFRKAFTPSEIVAIAAAIEPIERAKAKQRQGQRTDKHLEKFSRSSTGRALDKVATVAGTSRPTLLKARAVVDAGQADPARFGQFVAYMDESGRVDRAFKQLKIARAQQEYARRTEHGGTVADLRALAASCSGFGVIYVDAPLEFITSQRQGAFVSR
jgi:ParB family chromosome partitioning protein